MIARHQQIQWYCVRTHMKREQMAAEHLRRLIGVEAFSPRLRYRKATARGRIWWVEPLFPGYILARFHLDEMKRQVNHCMGVRGIVHFGNTIPVIPEVAVESLRDEVLKRSATDTVTTAPTIVVGDEVEVADGPLRGMNGVVLNLSPATERVRVLFEFMGESQPIELDLFSLLIPRRPVPYTCAAE